MLTRKEFESLVIPHLDAGRAPAWPCFEIVLFYDTPRSAMADGLRSVLHRFLDFAARHRPEPTLRWYRSNTMKASAAMTASAADMVDAFIGGAEFARPGIAGLTLHGGDAANAPVAPAFSLLSLDTAADAAEPVHRTMLRLCLPPSGAEEGRELFELAAACASAQAVSCGHAGYSWFSSTGDTRMERSFGERRGVLLKHPAMGYHDPLSYHPFVGEGLFQVGWLTVLGPKLLEQAEASEALVFPPESGVGVSRLNGHGAIVVAGPEPILGSRDPAQAAALAPYHAAGRRLASLSLADEDAEFLDFAGDPDEEAKVEWYRRFFGDA